MNAPPNVRISRPEENATIARVLTDAFVDEDGLNYWLRQGAAKDACRKLFFDAAVRDAVHPQRDLWLAEADGEALGAAIWLAPGRKAYDLNLWRQLMLMPLMLRIAGVSGMSRGFEIAERMEELHPREPHAHLVFLGVAPAAQGRGVGSTMLKHTLAPLDAAGLLGYLEVTIDRNIPLYERHGFVISGEIKRPGLHLRTMTRVPRT